jgi:CRP-like cAMP-binding protein
MRRIQAAIADPAAERRAYALELLSLLVAPDLRALVLPLFADLAPAERLRRLRAAFPQPRLGHTSRLAALIDAGTASPWTRACALHAAGQLGIGMLYPVAVGTLAAPAPLVQATALWTTRRPDGVEWDRYITRLHPDPDPQVARAIHQVGLARRGGARVLSTIEKVIILKTVGVFARLDDPLLAEVAGLLEEEEVAAGQTIFSEGDLGTSMYIIVDGEVRVHSGAHTLNHLNEREVFGEMALLDPEPRLASVTAVVDTHLLRLDQAPFYELLEDRIEMARGIIQMLSQRLRARVADLTTLRTRLAGLDQRPAGEA